MNTAQSNTKAASHSTSSLTLKKTPKIASYKSTKKLTGKDKQTSDQKGKHDTQQQQAPRT